MAGIILASGERVCLPCFMKKEFVLEEASEPLLDIELTPKDVCRICGQKIADIKL